MTIKKFLRLCCSFLSCFFFRSFVWSNFIILIIDSLIKQLRTSLVALSEYLHPFHQFISNSLALLACLCRFSLSFDGFRAFIYKFIVIEMLFYSFYLIPDYIRFVVCALFLTFRFTQSHQFYIWFFLSNYSFVSWYFAMLLQCSISSFHLFYPVNNDWRWNLYSTISSL